MPYSLIDTKVENYLIPASVRTLGLKQQTVMTLTLKKGRKEKKQESSIEIAELRKD